MKKFTEVVNVSDWEVDTDIGYVDIEKSNKTVEYIVYEIELEKYTIECADNHILIDTDGNEVFAKDSHGLYIHTDIGPQRVISVNNTGISEEMYDLQLSHHHKYYTNGILSHNTTVVGGYILHHAIFNKSFTIACLANKRDQAQEVLGRIQLMYERLPWWLQMGVKGWNKGDIWLDNGTKVFIAATSGSAVRGRSLNCFGPNTPVTLQHKKSLDIKTVQMHELEKELHAYNHKSNTSN